MDAATPTLGDLFPITLPEMIAEADREVKFRERVYPRMINAGKLSNANADRQISKMRAIRDYLQVAYENRNPKPG